ncbi:hypothetical protein T265_13720, partial [Opisthorchis viverrini]
VRQVYTQRRTAHLSGHCVQANSLWLVDCSHTRSCAHLSARICLALIDLQCPWNCSADAAIVRFSLAQRWQKFTELNKSRTESNPLLSDRVTMTTAAMLPPKLPSTPTQLHVSTGQLRGDHSSGDGQQQSLKFDDTVVTPNLSENSMMVLSQSVDSLHTLATNGGVDDTEHQVRTIFVSGLPLDAKPRELYLLFRGFKPVGFVTFDSREQAEDAMRKLQGVKFDPEGNQLMRLEFARTNTKVTKPKFISAGGVPFGGLSPTANALQAGLGQHTITGCPASLVAAGGLPALFTGLQPSILSQLANAGGTGPFDASSALFSPNDAATAVAAMAAQWNPLHASAYDNAAYLASAAGLLQNNNFRAIIPGTPTTFSLSPSTMSNFNMVQAAIAQANAAAALGHVGHQSNAAGHGPVLSMSPPQHQQQQQTQISPGLSANPTNSSPTSGSRTSPVNVSRGMGITFSATSQTPAQAQVNSFVAQLQQQQQQALAAVQLGQQQGTPSSQSHTTQPHQQQQQQQQQFHQALGFVPSSAGLPPPMAATIGILSGYNSLVKELTGNEAQLQSGLPPYHHQNPRQKCSDSPMEVCTKSLGCEVAQWLEREFTDRKVRGSNPKSASRLSLSRPGKPSSIPALVLRSGGMAAGQRKGAIAERFLKK